MGVSKHIKEEATARRQNKAQARQTRKGQIWTFHPTATQGAELQMGAMPWEDAMRVLSDRLTLDTAITIGYKPENAAYFAMLRDKAGKWDETNTICAWHSDLEKCLISLAFALKFVCQAFPPNLPAGKIVENEW